MSKLSTFLKRKAYVYCQTSRRDLRHVTCLSKIQEPARCDVMVVFEDDIRQHGQVPVEKRHTSAHAHDFNLTYKYVSAYTNLPIGDLSPCLCHALHGNARLLEIGYQSYIH